MGFVDDSIVAGADVRDVYALWLDYTAYPRFMSHVEDVAVVGYRRLRWRGRVCGGVQEWETEVVARMEDTLVRYQLQYDPDLWGADPEDLRACLHSRVHDDLQAFRRLADDLPSAAGRRAHAVDERPV